MSFASLWVLLEVGESVRPRRDEVGGGPERDAMTKERERPALGAVGGLSFLSGYFRDALLRFAAGIACWRPCLSGPRVISLGERP